MCHYFYVVLRLYFLYKGIKCCLIELRGFLLIEMDIFLFLLWGRASYCEKPLCSLFIADQRSSPLPLRQ